MQKEIKESEKKAYLSNHAELLISSHLRFTGKELAEQKASRDDMYRALYEAPYGIVSHGTEDDPIFNYGNRAALALFEMSWSEFIKLPSRESAEPVNREERQRLLARVSEYGFIDDYRGIRISSTGSRFWIKDATVWNLVDKENCYRGQAAVFSKWSKV